MGPIYTAKLGKESKSFMRKQALKLLIIRPYWINNNGIIRTTTGPYDTALGTKTIRTFQTARLRRGVPSPPVWAGLSPECSDHAPETRHHNDVQTGDCDSQRDYHAFDVADKPFKRRCEFTGQGMSFVM